MKYIDVKKLIAEIERLKATNPSEYNYQNAEGYIWALEDIEKFIDSPMQEQTELPSIGHVETYYQKGLHDGIIKGRMEILEKVAEIEKRKVEPILVIKEHEQPIKVYRVENEKEQKGLWRKFDGTWEPLFDMLTDGQCKDMPMEDNPIYREGGKQWFASAPSKETLQKWFSKRDLEELTANGFTISEFEVVGHKKVSDFEYIFTRDNIISRTYLSVSDIYPQEQTDVDFEKELKNERTKLLEVFGPMNGEQSLAIKNFARHFIELGKLNARKEG